MSYPEPPTTDWADLPLISEADNPGDFEDVWGEALDGEGWDRLQRMILTEGTFEDRPDTAPFDGAKYHAVDINVVFAWDDTAGEWGVLNVGQDGERVPGTAHFEDVDLGTASVETAPSEDEDVARKAEVDQASADAESDLNEHETSTSDVHGVGEADVASTDDDVTQFAPGSIAEGEVLTNEGGELSGTPFDAETDIDLLEVETLDDLPDPEDVEDPTITYVDEEDDYLGVFQE